MLEMFILNPPPRGAKKRDSPRVRVRRRRRLRLARNPKTGRFLKRTARKVRRLRNSKGKFSRRKAMATRTRRRRKAGGRRRYRRNAWFRQSRDHAIAAELGWAYQTRRRKKRRGSPRSYILGRVGKRRLLRYRARHPFAKRRKSARRAVSFRYPMFGRTYRLVANRRRRKSRRSRRRYMDNAPAVRRRRRSKSRGLPSRGRGGRFVSRRRGSRRRKRSYARNWFVSNPRRRRSRRRRYAKNWFVSNPVYDDNPRRRRSRRRRSHRRRRYADNRRRRRYMDNDAVADVMDTVKSVFDVEFLTDTALPVVGGFFGSRALSGIVGGAVMGDNYVGIVRHIGNLVSSGLAGAIAGFLTKNPKLAGNVLLGGVVNAVAGILRDLVKGVGFVSESPVLREAFGLSGLDGMGDDIKEAVEAEVMKELGVSDYLSAEQLARSERIGDFLSAEQLARSERIGQYPAETSGALAQYPQETSGVAQYPQETSGYAIADFADVASFGG